MLKDLLIIDLNIWYCEMMFENDFLLIWISTSLQYSWKTNHFYAKNCTIDILICFNCKSFFFFFILSGETGHLIL